MLASDRETQPKPPKSFRFQSPRDEPPVSVEDYLEGPPPSPPRPEDDD